MCITCDFCTKDTINLEYNSMSIFAKSIEKSKKNSKIYYDEKNVVLRCKIWG